MATAPVPQPHGQGQGVAAAAAAPPSRPCSCGLPSLIPFEHRPSYLQQRRHLTLCQCADLYKPSLLAIPAVLIPFVISSLVRLIQGSGTVAMITGASISAPILMNMPDVNMVFAAQAAAIGSMVFGYFNDS